MLLTPFDILGYLASFIMLYIWILCLISLIENRKNLYSSENKENISWPKVCIIVPCFNEEKTIAKTLDCLINLDYPKNKLEVLVVDDGSTDNTLKIAKQFEDQKMITVFHKENGGKYTALNYGLERTKAQFIGCLDADSFVNPPSLKKILSYFQDEEVMAVTSSIKIYQPKTILQYLQEAEYLAGIFLRKTFSLLGSMYVMPGPFTIFRREVFEKIGQYREAYHTEDIEMTLRLQKNNLKLKNALDVSVYTVGPNSFKKLYCQRIRWFYGFLKNCWDYRSLFGKKYGELGILLPLVSLSIFLVFSIIIYSIFNITSEGVLHFKNLLAIEFDFFPMFNPEFNWFFLNTSPFLFLGFWSLGAVLTVVILGKKLSLEENLAKKGILFYILFYIPLWFIWWLGVFYTICFKKKIVWKK